MNGPRDTLSSWVLARLVKRIIDTSRLLWLVVETSITVISTEIPRLARLDSYIYKTYTGGLVCMCVCALVV